MKKVLKIFLPLLLAAVFGMGTYGYHNGLDYLFCGCIYSAAIK